MRIFITLLALLGGAVATQAQTQPGDSWINYNNRYLKIPVAKEGVYRVSPAALSNAGVPAGTPGSAFRLFVKGAEVPLRATTSGVLGSSDYLEFAGFANDGAADAGLYTGGAAVQTDPSRSLFSDTIAYFLTWEAAPASVLRFQEATVVPPANPVVEGKCRVTSRQSFPNYFAQGRSNVSSYRFSSSQFEEGEGFIHAQGAPGGSFNAALPTPGALTGQGDARLTTGVVGYSLFHDGSGTPAPLHPIKIYVNGSLLVDTTYGAQQYCRFERTLSGGATAGTTPVTYQTQNTGAPNYDLWGVAFAQLEYWRNTDFAGQQTVRFKVAPAAGKRLISLGGFSVAGGLPVLYDLTHRKFYAANTASAGTAQFYVDAEANETEFFVTTTAAVETASITKNIQFTDYSAAGNSGDYVIVSHPGLNAGGAVDAYKSYRASAAGGSYKAIVAYCPDLYDQFSWGIAQHPMAVKGFLGKLQQSGTTKPKQVFILGHGIAYPSSRTGTAIAKTRSLVPTFGHPGSDALLTPDTGISIGRVSCLTPAEVTDYLTKVQAYDAGIKPAAMPTAATEMWKKKVLHIAGASDPNLQNFTLLPTLNAGKAIIEDSAFGGSVFTVAKNTTNPVDPFSNDFVDSTINSGNALMTFHGHAYAGGFDYNINDPEKYTNKPRLPLFLGLGCDVAQIFDTLSDRTISERYVLAPNGGAIAMVASDVIGFTDFHAYYLQNVYSRISQNYYGATMGAQVSEYNQKSVQQFANNGYYRTHFENMLFLGDPALRLFSPEKPDFHVNADGLSTFPAPVTSASDSFRLKIVAYNLGKLFKDTGLVVQVAHLSADGNKKTVTAYSVNQLQISDTAFVMVPIDKARDLGLNKYIVTIDPENKIGELSEANNEATLELFISGNNLIPVYPQNYGIVSRPDVTLKASTLNPFAGKADYRIELDTTQLFNSPALKVYETSGLGGVVHWQPGISMQDSTVYYWRSAYKPASGNAYEWADASFIYLPGAGPGWNQSHLYQYLPNSFDGLNYDADRQFRFDKTTLRVKAYAKVMDDVPNTVETNKVQVNEADFQRSSCNLYVTMLQIMIIDPSTGALRKNTPAEAAQIGSLNPCSANRGTWMYEFSTNDSASRNRARQFLESIPAGAMVLIKNSIYKPFYQPSSTANIWKSDTARYGTGISLYHTLHNMGFTQVDSFKSMQPFLFWSQKGSSSALYQAVGADYNTQLEEEFFVKPFTQSGRMNSITIGPSAEWKSLVWQTASVDAAALLNDKDTITVFGLPADGSPEVQLLVTGEPLTSLAGISVAAYPKLRLSWKADDSVTRSAGQLRYWRVLHTPLPELALNPAAHYTFQKEDVESGEYLNFEVALENVSDEPMREVLVKYRALTSAGTLLLDTVRQRALPAGDTLHTRISFSSVPFSGRNFLFVEANPDGDQPEAYHPNNLGYIAFHVNSDVYNPLLDVTFNEVHIWDRAIVAPRPAIKIRFSDDSRFRALDDTSLIDVYLRKPEDPITLVRGTRINFDGQTCRFIPSGTDSTGAVKNEAYILYQPTLTTPSTSEDDGLYELLVQGRDRQGNKTGTLEYRVSFRTVAGAGITNVYNYPNPFSATTQFAFLITGEAVPEFFTIQVVDLQGRLVRTIQKSELGPVVVGQNYTSYRWDGRDEAGVALPSGVYLYRAVLSGANSALPNLPSGVDGGFKNGWGRMVIVR